MVGSTLQRESDIGFQARWPEGANRILFPPTHERTNEWWYGSNEATSQGREGVTIQGLYGLDEGILTAR